MDSAIHRHRPTELYLSAHVSTGLVVIFLSSKIQSLDDLTRFFSRTFDWIFTILSFCLAGFLTCIIRKSVLTQERGTHLDANILTKADILTIAQAAAIFIFGIAPLILPSISKNLLQYFSLATLVSVVSLNTYFSNFWMERNVVYISSTNMDALKLEYCDWENLFKNVSLIFLIPIGGVVYKY